MHRLKSLASKAVAPALVVAFGLFVSGVASALVPPPGPSSGSTGLEAHISTAPPKNAPTIATPSSGQVFTKLPITVSGLCSTQTVKIFDSNVFVGAAECKNGSYQLQIDLFSGKNDLLARQYDALDQQSPDSNKVSVTFNDARFAKFGTRVTLTSDYARKGADPGDTLSWPIQIVGGHGPYALSVDWGDNTPPSLQSASSPGEVDVTHVYDSAGTYTVIVKATDANGTVAFLQLVGVANGKVTATAATTKPQATVETQVIWWPSLILLPLVLVAFWLGRRHQMASIRRELEQSRYQ